MVNPYVEAVKTGWYYLSGEAYRDLQQKSYQTQIDYEEYIKRGNQRARDDWYRNVGSKGRTIRYPELSYSGQINRSNTAVARNLIDYSIADTNYYSNLPYRVAGLYGVAGGFSRYL